MQENRPTEVTRVHPLTKSVLVYSCLNFKGKPHHLSQLGRRELYSSMFSIRPGWGCHLHITSVSYPNVPALCIQMEAFILPLLGLHPSNALLTGIPMFPTTAVSDSVFSAFIWGAFRNPGVLANRPLQSAVQVALRREHRYPVVIV